MLNSRFKIFFLIFLILFSLVSLFFPNKSIASEENIITNNDIYIKNNETTEITNMIIGNAFISSKDFILSPYNKGGVISGNLFVKADTVTIKSDSVYSENGDLESINVSSQIFNNAFIMTDKFVLEPGCSIQGDLYIVAKEIDISQSSIIYGNAFISSEIVNLSGQIYGNAYISSNNFNMKFNGLLFQDLYLTSKNSEMSGLIKRNAYINSENFTSHKDFSTSNNLEVNSSSIDFSGEVNGNAKFTAKNISFNNTSSILGNLDYISNKKLDIPFGIVNGETNFSKLKIINFSLIISYVIGIVSLISYIILIYFILKKFFNTYIFSISKLNWIDLLKFLGVGLLILLVLPIIIILLFFIRIGYLLAFVLLSLYLLLLSLSIPILIIAFSEFIKSNFNKFPTWVYIIIFSVILFGLSLIPYVGFIITVLTLLIGLGMLVLRTIKK